MRRGVRVLKLTLETCVACGHKWEGRFDNQGRCCIKCGHEWTKTKGVKDVD